MGSNTSGPKRTGGRTRLPKSHEKHLNTIRDLAAKGLNKTQILISISCGKNSFGKYKEFDDAFDKGRNELAIKVSGSFIAALKDSYSDRIALSKSLRLFSSSFNVGEIETMEDAQRALSAAIQAFSECRISESELETFRKSLSSFVDSVSSTQLEQRLLHLEELLEKK